MSPIGLLQTEISENCWTFCTHILDPQRMNYIDSLTFPIAQPAGWQKLISGPNDFFQSFSLLIYIPSPLLTPGVSPACDPAVVSRIEAGLLAWQAGVADEVWRDDICGSLHQGDVVVQLAVSRVTEVLVPVDSLHGENSLCCLWALQLVFPQDDPPAPSILSFTPKRPINS